MLLSAQPPIHLTYCTNIHPAEGWLAVDRSVRTIVPALKKTLSPGAPFGIGLRLGAREARELREAGRVRAFRAFLDDEGLYVALLNGFPYGPFHGEPVKTNVYAPDWRTEARVEYTLNLANILAALLPDNTAGGISTVPLSYKAWMQNAAAADWDAMVTHLVDVCEQLVQLRRETGRAIHLDIEPEPDCVLETATETIAFFEQRLRPIGAPLLARRLGSTVDQALEDLNEHIQVCFDCCHCAVEYEDPIEALSQFRRAGVRIGRVQLSSALKVMLSADSTQARATAARLEPFHEPIYLHQVIEQGPGQLRRFSDLDTALPAAAGSSRREWRIHFHVPLFAAAFDGLGSSQDVVRAVLREARRAPFTEHLEIETYTWSVLPESLKVDIGASIAREYTWVLGEWNSAR